jgi:hypothetical protein
MDYMVARASRKAVVEQAVSVCCMLSHNPDNHFAMVSSGLVPELVPLVSPKYSDKTKSYVLASLLMLALLEPRHAAVVVRAGIVPRVIEVAAHKESSRTNLEFAAALLACLTQCVETQVDVVACGGIPALVQ